MTFWFMFSYVCMLAVGVGLGIWHYRRVVPKRYRELCADRGMSGNDIEGIDDASINALESDGSIVDDPGEGNRMEGGL